MKYKITFKYRYGIDYVYVTKYKVDDYFVQPLKDNNLPLCTIARTNIISMSKLDYARINRL